jgi:hypothetical protein
VDRKGAASDMDRLGLNEGAKLGAQRLVGDQIDGTAQGVF